MENTVLVPNKKRKKRVLSRTIQTICVGVFRTINIILAAIYVFNILLTNISQFLKIQVRDASELLDNFHIVLNHIYLLTVLLKLYTFSEQQNTCLSIEIGMILATVWSGIVKITPKLSSMGPIGNLTGTTKDPKGKVIPEYSTSEYICLVCIIELHCFSVIALLLRRYILKQNEKALRRQTLTQNTEYFVIDAKLTETKTVRDSKKVTPIGGSGGGKLSKRKSDMRRRSSVNLKVVRRPSTQEISGLLSEDIHPDTTEAASPLTTGNDKLELDDQKNTSGDTSLITTPSIDEDKVEEDDIKSLIDF